VAELVSVGAEASQLERIARKLGATPRVAGTPGAAVAAGMIGVMMRS
jgi:hypothetical protein